MGVGQELNKVIVVGIPTNSTAEDLRLLCKPFGGIAEATVVSDAEGKGRGFGFVRFETEAAQLECVEKLNKTLIKGRTLNVRVVEKRSPSGASAPRWVRNTASWLTSRSRSLDSRLRMWSSSPPRCFALVCPRSQAGAAAGVRQPVACGYWPLLRRAWA